MMPIPLLFRLTPGCLLLALLATTPLLAADPVNTAPTVNAGADLTIHLPNAAQLVATVTDDGLPTPPLLLYLWDVIGGPGTVDFSAETSPTTSATFSAAGVYVLRLIAFDGALYGTDRITITVKPPNAAPVVNAGPDQAITLPAGASLAASASDDGNPAGSTLTHAWTKISGPGTVTFSAATSLTGTATFSAAGTYVLQLSTSDGDLTSTDTVTIIVSASASNGAGDLNGDKVVNITDLTLVTSHFGQSSSHPSWNPLSDSNGDGVVNITDLTSVTSQFGRIYL